MIILQNVKKKVDLFVRKVLTQYGETCYSEKQQPAKTGEEAVVWGKNVEYTRLQQLLEIRPGVTAVSGSGGKTTLLHTLGQELADGGHTVILCTTTKIFPFPDLPNLTGKLPEALEDRIRQHRLVCVGTPLADTGKLTVPNIPMDALSRLAEYVLVEADGSARRPLKAHSAHEPVIPPEADQTICVVGVSGFGTAIEQAAHRPEIFAALAGKRPEELAQPEDAAEVINREGLASRCFFNQADTPERWEWARRAAMRLDCPAAIGSLQKEVYFLC